MIEQIDLFSSVLPKFHIGNRRIKLIELFGGIGAQAMALTKLGANYDHHRLVEFDAACVKSYNAIHGTDFEPTDIRDVHATDLDIRDDGCVYIFCYSFPCQDLSLANSKKRGISKDDWEAGNSSRSGLLWEVERILLEQYELSKRDKSYVMPQILLCENVPQLISSKNIKETNKFIKSLESLGYSNYARVLDAQHYGLPQMRKRCFIVSIAGQYHYDFPRKKHLEYRLKDFMDSDVNESRLMPPEGEEMRRL